MAASCSERFWSRGMLTGLQAVSYARHRSCPWPKAINSELEMYKCHTNHLRQATNTRSSAL